MTYTDEPEEGIRLQRVLAAAGIGSRRACDQLIEDGKVEVDGKTVLVQGMRVDPKKAVIKVDGMRIATAPDHVYLVLNKPKGVVSTMSDPEGRPSLQDYVGDWRRALRRCSCSSRAGPSRRRSVGGHDRPTARQ